MFPHLTGGFGMKVWCADFIGVYRLKTYTEKKAAGSKD